jgi:hypothetical protein
VRIHASANPRHDRAITQLPQQITATEHTYPGTQLKLTYTPAGAVSNPNPGSSLFTGDQDEALVDLDAPGSWVCCLRSS